MTGSSRTDCLFIKYASVKRTKVKRYIPISKQIYDTSRFKEYKRMVVFLFRVWTHDKKMEDLYDFFQATPLKRELSSRLPFFYEQATRQFFYKESSFDDRFKIIENHFNYLESLMDASILRKCYLEGGLKIWEGIFEEKKLSFILTFEAGQKKEGLLSLILWLDNINLYQIIFWIAPDPADRNPALWIGAIQGSNTENALDIIRQLTKHFHGYRTKNLIFYAVQTIANVLGITSIYAVSDEVYYTNNHVRLDRKLKISLDEFWREVDGTPSEDKRFYKLPLSETRKSMEEIKSSKRSLYRKRFETLDGIKEIIEINLRNCLKL